jgi:cobalt-zinc-cadmium efflux system membrane fusion protein
MNRLLIFALSILFFTACKEEVKIQAEHSDNYVDITKEQFVSGKMVLGKPEKNEIEEKIHFSGKIIALADGVIRITAPVEGIVKEILVHKGQSVIKNTSLVRIGGNDLIELQQEFAVSSAKIKQLKADYERAKVLYLDSIKTENEFLLAESVYKSELAGNKALKLKLQLIGLDISNVEKGNYVSAYTLKSPIGGQVSSLNAMPGQYINRENEITQIVDKRKVELQLSFFENDFPKIKQGQKVIFNNLNSSEYTAQAVIERVGAMLSPTSNTLDCYASINKKYLATFAVNQMVHGQVIVSADTVFAVPRNAVLSEGNHSYVILLEGEKENGYQFKKQIVKTGKSDKHKIELLDFNEGSVLLIKGVENIVLD